MYKENCRNLTTVGKSCKNFVEIFQTGICRKVIQRQKPYLIKWAVASISSRTSINILLWAAKENECNTRISKMSYIGKTNFSTLLYFIISTPWIAPKSQPSGICDWYFQDRFQWCNLANKFVHITYSIFHSITTTEKCEPFRNLWRHKRKGKWCSSVMLSL